MLPLLFLLALPKMSPLFVYVILFLWATLKHQWSELYNHHWSTTIVAQEPQILEV